MSHIPVAVLGATGSVGQRFVQLLERHPWFRVAELFASARSAGRPYRDAARWVLDGEAPTSAADLIVQPLNEAPTSRLIFSALPKEIADPLEAQLAAAGHFVCSNASTHRLDDDVPILLPLANAEHLSLLKRQQHERGWRGGIITNSNCTTTPVVMALAPLLSLGIEQLHIVSAQAISGAGHPGVASLDILDNIIPYIANEEAKLAREPLKMLGTFGNDRIEPLSASVSATCMRVPVLDGHLVNIAMRTRVIPPLEEIRAAWGILFTASRNHCSAQRAPARPEIPHRARSPTTATRPQRWRRHDYFSGADCASAPITVSNSPLSRIIPSSARRVAASSTPNCC